MSLKTIKTFYKCSKLKAQKQLTKYLFRKEKKSSNTVENRGDNTNFLVRNNDKVTYNNDKDKERKFNNV